MASALEWHVTGLWHPADTDLSDLPYYGMIADPLDGDVGLLLNDSTSAEVTLPDTDPVAAACYKHSYARCLRAYYHGVPVHWGPCKLIAGDLKGTVKLTSVDPSIRLINHFARRGDLTGYTTAALTAANDDQGYVTVDHIGLRMLRDAGLNTAGQTARGVPDLGIIDGTNDFGSPVGFMGVHRGDQVWNSMIQLSQSLGPDFELQPIEDTVGAYAKLNTYTMQGDDVSADTVFHYGTGRQNLIDLQFVEGSKYITHDHVLSRDLKLRVTAANEDASADTGPYVEWDATDYDETGIDRTAAEDVLKAYGEDVLKAYSRPLTTVQLILPPESIIGYRYGTDYKIGDRVGIAGRNGLIDLEQADYRITAIRLKQTGRDGDIQPEIEVIPDRVAAAGDDVSSTEEG